MSGTRSIQREGTTLIAECPVSFTTAALGGTISLPGLDGKQIEVKIPAGIQSGEQLRLRGAGMSVLNGRGRGDLVARILVETPTRLIAKQKKLLRGIPLDGDVCVASTPGSGTYCWRECARCSLKSNSRSVAGTGSEVAAGELRSDTSCLRHGGSTG